MIDTVWKEEETGEIRHVMVEAIGSGSLIGQHLLFTCNQDGEEYRAHERLDFLRRHYSVEPEVSHG